LKENIKKVFKKVLVIVLKGSLKEIGEREKTALK
jgi:hypothetical protein